jgi:parallel beta-helix repeat protein
MDSRSREAICSLFVGLTLGCALTGAFLALSGVGRVEALGSPSAVGGAPDLVRYVAPGGACGDAAPCYGSVQHAVDAAGEGDEIRVATGTYTGTGDEVLRVEKTVTIRGGYTVAKWSVSDPNSNVTVLDGEDARRVIYIVGQVSPVIEGFRITGGYAEEGGGAYIVGASAMLRDNRIEGNRVYSAQNSRGGGLYLDSSPARITGNSIEENHANAAWGNGYGGGVYLDSSPAILDGNVVQSNTVAGGQLGSQGGGLYLRTSPAQMSGNTIRGNEAFGDGGGLVLDESDAELTNNVVADNESLGLGNGMYMVSSSPRLLHTTIARNTGGEGIGLFAGGEGPTGSTAWLTNTILVSHTVGVRVEAGSAAVLQGVLWYGNTASNWGGDGTIEVSDGVTGSPHFAADGFHLTGMSTAIDQGVDTGTNTDIDGESRFTEPDLGADEYWAPGELLRVYVPVAFKGDL